MATGTNLENDLQRALAKAAECRWVGDYDGALYWEHEAQTYSDRVAILESRAKWSTLADGRRG